MASKMPMLGAAFRKIEPKLRMVANGSPQVNEVRADFNPAVQMAPSFACATEAAPHQIMGQVAFTARKVLNEPKRGKLKELPDEVRVSVFIERDGEAASPTLESIKGISAKNVTAERGRLATLEVRVSDLPQIAAQESIVRIEMGETLKHPRPRISSSTVSAPGTTQRRFGANGGKNVLVGIIDVEGFDFAHPDFLDAQGGTRFVSIWDQGGDNRPNPSGFNFGSEITKAHMDAAIAASSTQGLAAQLLEPQSAMEHASHGTHVASIAAGNRGVCRNAFLTGVLIDLPRADFDRRKSFYDSTRIAHAVEYILSVAEQLRIQHGLDTLPVSINISLGTNGHAHDGSSAVCRWLEHLLSTAGRSVTVAAGNAGQEGPEHADDIGFIMGRIHSSGRIAARGLVNDIDWVVVGNGLIDVSENELEIWYSASDRFALSIKPPGQDWIGPIQPGQFIENRQLANGANYIGVYLTPFFSANQIASQPMRRSNRMIGLAIPKRFAPSHSWS